MDSDDDQIIKKQTTKKTKGRKKSTTTKTTKSTTTTNKKTKGRRIKNILNSDSEDEQQIESQIQLNKKQKLDHNKLIDNNLDNDLKTDNLFKKIDVDKLNVTNLTPSTSTQLFTATSRLNIPLHDNKPLDWSHKVNLIGEKSVNCVNLCDLCKEPILYYGRLMTCKHVFCYDCAIELKEKGNCLRCNDRILRVERNQLNSVYICNHDKQCKRTYLSQRDLSAHIQHRHTKKEKTNNLDKNLIKRTHTFNNINLSTNKDDFQSNSLIPKSNNGHHSSHYPQPSLHTLQYVKQVQQQSTVNSTKSNFKFSNRSSYY